MVFGYILGRFWDAFGSILGSKNRSELEAIFSSFFWGLIRSGATSTGLRRGYFLGGPTQGGALLARGGIL